MRTLHTSCGSHSPHPRFSFRQFNALPRNDETPHRWQSDCTTPRRMRSYPSVYPENSEFRVEKNKVAASLTLSNGSTIKGAFFVWARSANHDGPERVKDVLNGETGFVPVEVTDGASTRTILYNRDHILYVELGANPEARLDPGYDVATHRRVSMLLINGVRLHGLVSVYRPRGLDRLSDFARSPERFRYLEGVSATYLINVQHTVELTEEFASS